MSRSRGRKSLGERLGVERPELVTAAQKHPVIDLLKARIQSRSTPTSREDGLRLGLAIEGGGMRGVIGAGMVAALETLGASFAFDVVTGSSAGAFNAAYFVAEQARYGTTIYYDDLTHNFVGFNRDTLRNGRLLDMDYVFNEVLTVTKPLDLDRILASEVTFAAVTSSIAERKSVTHTEFGSTDELMLVLRAGSALPVLAGPPILLHGELHTDGGLHQAFPYRSAIELGCDHVLVLTSRFPRIQHVTRSRSDQIAGLMLRRYPGLADDIAGRHERYRTDVALIQQGTIDPKRAPFICNISPATQPVSRLTRNHADMVEGAMAGFRAVLEVLTGETPQLVEMIAGAPSLTPVSPPG